jgi:hypothetical protein
MNAVLGGSVHLLEIPAEITRTDMISRVHVTTGHEEIDF